MTFIAGYIYKNAVNIVADSAVTSFSSTFRKERKPPSNFITSFGELFHIGDGFIVEEASQKIYNIDNKMLLTFSGDVREGLNTIKDIILHYKHFASLSGFLNNFFECNPYLKTSYIIGFIENNKPHLFASDKDLEYRLIDKEFTVAVAGANPQNIRQGIEDVIMDAIKNKFSIQETLQQVIVSYQMMTMSFRTIESGVGGFLNGAIVSKNGIEWARDTYYLLASANNYEKGQRTYVIKFNRDDCVFILNPQIGKIFRSEISPLKGRKLRKKWSKELSHKFDKLLADFYVIILYDINSAIILNHKKQPTVKIIDGVIYLDPVIREWTRLYSKNGFRIQTNFKK